jgi:hypothetical protein
VLPSKGLLHVLILPQVQARAFGPSGLTWTYFPSLSGNGMSWMLLTEVEQKRRRSRRFVRMHRCFVYMVSVQRAPGISNAVEVCGGGGVACEGVRVEVTGTTRAKQGPLELQASLGPTSPVCQQRACHGLNCRK